MALLSILLLGVRQSRVSISGLNLNFLWAGFFLLESLKFEGLEVIFIEVEMGYSTGYRIKVAESAGTPMGMLLPSTNLQTVKGRIVYHAARQMIKG